MLEGLSGGSRPRSNINNRSGQQLGRNVGTAIALIVLYFLLTKLSQGLMRESQPEFAFFWPPTGFAAAIMICLRRPTRWLFLFGVPVANVVAELTVPVGTIGLGEMGMFAVGNVAEPLVTATLVERYLGANFSIERSRDLLGLFAAALVGITLSVTWYASVYKLALYPAISFLPVWLELFLSHLVGFISIGPLVIALFAAERNPPPLSETVDGTLAVLGVLLITGLIAFLPPEHWNTVTPLALLLPILLWVAFRCRPLFSAAAAFSLSMSIVWITIFKIGHFGDANLATRERLLQVQAIILVAAVSALVLSVLFAERKENEMRLARINAQLKREQDNRLMNLGAVAAVMSHEIKQPLTAMVANAAAIQNFLGREPLDLQEARSAADDVVNDSHRIGEILNNLRALFGQSLQGSELIDVNELALSVLQNSRDGLSDHGIAPVFNLMPGLPPVVGHRGQLEEVLLNLIHNAIEAMTSTTADRRALQVRTKVDGEKALVVEIEDSGPGFNPENSERIFDAFVTTKPHGGGLGLAICRTIIERHDGQLSAVSDGRNGALFRIHLPISARP
jgi:signal transduction histidine kinase